MTPLRYLRSHPYLPLPTPFPPHYITAPQLTAIIGPGVGAALGVAAVAVLARQKRAQEPASQACGEGEG